VIIPYPTDEGGLVPLDVRDQTLAEEPGLVPLDAHDWTLPDEAGLVPLDAARKTTTAPGPEEDLLPLDREEAATTTAWDEEPIGGGYDVGAASTGNQPNLASPVYGEIACFRLRRKEESPGCVAFSADGKRGFAAVGGTVFVLDPRAERILEKFKIHDAAIGCVAISPDGRQALTGADDQRGLRLWSLETGRTLARLTGHDAPVRSVAFSPDGQRALSGGDDGDVLLWDATTGKERECLEGRIAHGIRAVGFSPDGLAVLAAGGDGQIRQWKVPTGRRRERLDGATGAIAAAVFARNGRRVVAASADPATEAPLALWQWDAATGERLPCAGDSPQSEGKVTAVAFLPGGNRVLVASISEKPRSLRELRGRVALVDPDSLLGWPGFFGGLVGAAVGAPLGAIVCMGVAGLLGGLMGILAGAGGGSVVGWVMGGVLVNMAKGARNPVETSRHYLLHLWDVDDGNRLMSYEGHQGPIRCLAVAPNGLLALSGAEDGTVRVWGLPP
jgi:WD40 repeat protein